MDLLTVIFSDEPYDKMMESYEWTHNYFTNTKVIWNIEKLDTEEINKLDSKKQQIMPMKIQDWANQPKYESYFLGWFQQEKPDYYCAITSETMVIDNDYEDKVLEIMKKQKIFGMFPYLHSQWTNKKHPLAQQLQGLMSKQWTMPGMNVLDKLALQYYGQSFIHFPDYFHWLRYPTVLANAGFHITSNPFLDTEKTFVIPPSSKEGEESWELDEVLIKNAVKDKVSALFPIKDFSKTAKIIEEVKNEQKKA